MKNVIITGMLLVSSLAFAWSPGFDVMVKELKQSVPKEYTYSGVIANDGNYTIITSACMDPTFVADLHKKYSSPKEAKRMFKLGVHSIFCEYDGDGPTNKKWIY